MKKTILILILGAMPAVAFTGCGGTQDQDVEDSAPTVEQHGDDSHDDTGHDMGHDMGHDTDDQDTDDHHADASAPATEEHGHDAHDAHGSTGDDHHASAAGSPGDAANVDRTVEVTMHDSMRFTPDRLTFDAGETVRFVIRNDGKIPHEFVIGSMAELLEHAAMMRAMPDMQHAEANMLTLAPGAEGEIIWSFDAAGTVDFACLIPGHLEAGMKGVIEVG